MNDKKYFIFVDLDGTLIKKDSSFIALKYLFKRRPWLAIKVAFNYFVLGESWSKFTLGGISRFLLENSALLSYLSSVKEKSHIILATGASFKVARRVVKNYKVFDSFIASTKTFNCVGQNKLDKIKSLVGGEPFMYIANHWHDWPVWSQANKIGVVEPSKVMLNFLNKSGKQVLIF